MLPMQKGDVTATWASNKLLKHLTGFTPSVTLEDGISHFIDCINKNINKLLFSTF